MNWDIVGFFLFMFGVSVCEVLISIFSDNEKFRSSIFRRLPIRWFLRSESWKNVFKKYPGGELLVKYHNRLNFPVYKEKFFGSSTLFSWIFDAFSFFSTSRNLLFFLGVSWLSGLRSNDLFIVGALLTMSLAFVRYMVFDLFTVKKKPSK